MGQLSLRAALRLLLIPRLSFVMPRAGSSTCLQRRSKLAVPSYQHEALIGRDDHGVGVVALANIGVDIVREFHKFGLFARHCDPRGHREQGQRQLQAGFQQIIHLAIPRRASRRLFILGE